MRSCFHCGEMNQSTEWYTMGHDISTMEVGSVKQDGEPNNIDVDTLKCNCVVGGTVTVQEGLQELFEDKIQICEKDEICKRCYDLLSRAMKFWTQYSYALEKFLSQSTNHNIRIPDKPLTKHQSNTAVNYKAFKEKSRETSSVIGSKEDRLVKMEVLKANGRTTCLTEKSQERAEKSKTFVKQTNTDMANIKTSDHDEKRQTSVAREYPHTTRSKCLQPVVRMQKLRDKEVNQVTLKRSSDVLKTIKNIDENEICDSPENIEIEESLEIARKMKNGILKSRQWVEKHMFTEFDDHGEKSDVGTTGTDVKMLSRQENITKTGDDITGGGKKWKEDIYQSKFISKNISQSISTIKSTADTSIQQRHSIRFYAKSSFLQKIFDRNVKDNELVASKKKCNVVFFDLFTKMSRGRQTENEMLQKTLNRTNKPNVQFLFPMFKKRKRFEHSRKPESKKMKSELGLESHLTKCSGEARENMQNGQIFQNCRMAEEGETKSPVLNSFKEPRQESSSVDQNSFEVTSIDGDLSFESEPPSSPFNKTVTEKCWKCLICAAEFRTKIDVIQHVKMRHGNVGKTPAYAQMSTKRQVYKSTSVQSSDLSSHDQANENDSSEVQYDNNGNVSGQSVMQAPEEERQSPYHAKPSTENMKQFIKFAKQSNHNMKQAPENLKPKPQSAIETPSKVLTVDDASETSINNARVNPLNEIKHFGCKSTPKFCIKKENVNKLKCKMKETSEIFVIKSKSDSIRPDSFVTPPREDRIDLRQALSVKWYCKLCPNWYRSRKSCLQHIHNLHKIKGNWARFYFHNSQQVSFHPSMEIRTGPHVNNQAHLFCIICGRLANDKREFDNHMRRYHSYVKEETRKKLLIDKREGIHIIVVFDIFLDLHVYLVGNSAARIVDKELFSEIFETCTSGPDESHFKPHDLDLCRKLKRVLLDENVLDIDSSDQQMLGDVTHDFEVYSCSIEEDFQWERKNKSKGIRLDIGHSVKDETSEEKNKDMVNCNLDNSEKGSLGESGDIHKVENSHLFQISLSGSYDHEALSKDSVNSKPITLHRCHECNVTFKDRMYLDEHNLTRHSVGMRFSCRICFKQFTKLFFLLEHLVDKHRQKHPTYFQFVIEHDNYQEGTVTLLNSDQKESETIVSSDNETSKGKEEDEKDVNENEKCYSKNCFVCGENMETRLARFAHLKDSHQIYKSRCLMCDKNFPCKADLKTHFADLHNIKFSVDKIEKDFQCFVCDLIFTSKNELKEHMTVHENNGDYQCNLCESKYKTASSLRFHKRTEHSNLDRMLTCTICNVKEFKSMKQFESHMISHFYDFLGPVKCNKCGLTLKNKALYQQHLRSHGRSLICETCGKKFHDQASMRHHLVTHDLSEECLVCHKRLSRYNLKPHMTNVHGQRKKSQCPNCKKFVCDSYLKTHIEEIHIKQKNSEKRNRVCDICGKKFKRPGLLKMHLVVHNGNKPYSCELCSRPFGYKTALKTHYKTHKGYNPFKCLYCDETFHLVKHRTEHMKTEHGYMHPDQKHECNYCRKRFRQMNSLRLHMDEVHPDKIPGHKSYSCHICQKRFKYRRSVKEHESQCKLRSGTKTHGEIGIQGQNNNNSLKENKTTFNGCVDNSKSIHTLMFPMNRKNPQEHTISSHDKNFNYQQQQVVIEEQQQEGTAPIQDQNFNYQQKQIVIEEQPQDCTNPDQNFNYQHKQIVVEEQPQDCTSQDQNFNYQQQHIIIEQPQEGTTPIQDQNLNYQQRQIVIEEQPQDCTSQDQNFNYQHKQIIIEEQTQKGATPSQDQNLVFQQQHIIIEQPDNLPYHTIFIEDLQAQGKQLYVQGHNQVEITLPGQEGEIMTSNEQQQGEVNQQNELCERFIVALPEDCGEFDVEFVTREDEDIGMAEIVISPSQ